MTKNNCQGKDTQGKDTYSVLITEDNDVIVKSLTHIFKDSDLEFIIDTANNAEKAKELADKNKYDIFLLDYYLGPEGTETGYDVYKYLETKGKNKNVIFISGTPGKLIEEFNTGKNYYTSINEIKDNPEFDKNKPFIAPKPINYSIEDVVKAYLNKN